MRAILAGIPVVLMFCLAGCQGGKLKLPDFGQLEDDIESSTGLASAEEDQGGSSSGTESSAGTTAGASSATSSDSTGSSVASEDASSSEPNSGEDSTATAYDSSQPFNTREDIDTSGTERYGWTDARVGWMTRTRMSGDMEMTMEVVEAEDRLLLVETKTIMGGQEVSGGRMWMPRYVKVGDAEQMAEDNDIEYETTELADEVLEVGGQKVKCKVTKTIMKMPGQTITSIGWMSENVPGWLVKAEGDFAGSGMQLVSELIDFRK